MASITPDEKEVRAALARLVAHGIDSVWLPETQALLEVPSVRRKIEELGADHAGDALRQVLSDAVESLGQSQYRRLLTIVLGLEPEYAEMSAGDKRSIAGQQFRGGSKPVGPGTIRQHHEPRALDELAAVLCAFPPHKAASAGETVGERQLSGFEWHPTVRSAWSGERLVFWRLSFGSHDPRRAIERVKVVMESAGISSWAAFEAFGAFDLLIRAWLPSTVSQANFKTLVLGELADLQLHFDFFAVDKVIRHWPWVQRDRTMAEPSRGRLIEGMPSRDIESINSGANPERLREYEREGIIAPIHERAGIGFMVVVTPPGPAFVPSLTQQANIEGSIANLVDRVGEAGFSELSLYAGSGFASYLLQGRVSPVSFHELERSLVRPLDEIVRADGSRTYTFVMPASAPLARVEKMPSSTSPPTEMSAEELLRQDEGAHFEVKMAAFGHGFDDSARFTTGLARAVVGFLNSSGGTIVIGAAEKDRLRRVDPRVAASFEGAPEVGSYAVRGIEGDASKGYDAFGRRLLDTLDKLIDPDPSIFIRMRFDQVGGRTVCILELPNLGHSGGTPWFYCREGRSGMQFLVRQGSRSVNLSGVEADRYRMQNVRPATPRFTGTGPNWD